MDTEIELYDEKGLLHDRVFEWIQTASPDERCLFDKVCNFGDFFSDMLFKPGSITNEFIAIQTKATGDEEWHADFTDLPEELEDFSYDSFIYRIEDLGDNAGRFTYNEYKLSVAPEYLNDDSVVLHEMIHMHEMVINSLPLFYHDALLWSLYKDISKKINDLDKRIVAHGQLLNSHAIFNCGGTHDILFLLKSFDLDLKMGYQLGTVFGYGMAQE